MAALPVKASFSSRSGPSFELDRDEAIDDSHTMLHYSFCLGGCLGRCLGCMKKQEIVDGISLALSSPLSAVRY